MIRSALVVAGLLLASLLWSASARADYAGPGSTGGSKTGADILKSPRDDERVVLRGQLVRKVGDEEYIFSDGTGEIRVEIDDDAMPSQTIDEKTRVEIDGEVDTHLLKPPEIDAEAVRVLG